MKNAQRLAVATCFATLFLITLGVLVRVTGSGLGCPDWPTCYGSVVPPGQQSSLIEFSHRITASIVGFMVIGVAVMAWISYRHVPFITWMATITVPLVGFQGILGAIAVVRELPPEVVATHLLTAMLVLWAEVAVAIAMYREDPDHQGGVVHVTPQARRIGLVALVTMGWLAVTFWVGGYMAESGASTACKGWPLCNGSLLPAADSQEITHMLHRYLAGGVVFLIVPFVVMAWRARGALPWAGWLAIAAGSLYVVQVVLGALNVWYTFPDVLAIAHTTVAAGIWLTLAAAAVSSYYAPAAERASRRSPAGIGVTA